MIRGGSRGPAGPGADEGLWGELSALVEYLEDEASRVEGRAPRPAREVWAEVERHQAAAPSASEPGRGGPR